MFGASKSGSAAVKDPQFKYDTLLLNGDGTNGAQNNTFLDSSSNNLTITRSGSATQGTFTPFGPNWSNYFGGSDNLSYGSNALLSFGTGDFTAEAWVYVTSVGTGFSIFNCGGASNGSYSLYVYTNSGSKFQSTRYGDTAGAGTTTNAVALNTWVHVAAVRSSGTAYVYVNGVLDSGATYAMGSITNTGGSSGLIWGGSTTGTGYISNLRIIKGTALYTSNFTPSTTPLTAITNTSLLTCQSNRFVDNSANALAITSTGTPSVQRFSPFSPPSSYNPSVIGGSMYFGGSSDLITVPASAALEMGSGDFTYEFWINPPSAPTQVGIWAQSPNASTYGPLWIEYAAGTINLLATTANGSWNIVNFLPVTGTITLNVWTHIAITRSSGVWRAFVNGVQSWTITNSGSLYATNSIATIGGFAGSTTYAYTGYISNFRVIKGTALYTANFTPPTAPLTAITNTSLLLNTTNAGIYDSAMMNDVVTVGDAQVSTAVVKYGTGSMKFDGTGDYLSSTPSITSSLGTGDFTIETWVYLASASTYQFLIGSSDNASGYMMIGLNVPLSPTSTIAIGRSGISWPVQFGNSITLTSNTWTHIAITRSGTSNRAFINGVQLGSTVTDSTSWSFPSNVFWVGYQTGGTTINGYLDDFRITKGYARYTANFTPPTAAFPTS
jgi:hypothetical protein